MSIDWSQLVTPEDKAALAEKAAREAFKAARSEAVKAITVTTSAGNTFDGDEESQGRMARAILTLQITGGTKLWVMADNSEAEVGAAELAEALAMADAEQTRLWRPNASTSETQKDAPI